MNLIRNLLIRKLTKKECKTVLAPHKKSEQTTSNKQPVNEIAVGLKAFADSSIRQHQIMMEAE